MPKRTSVIIPRENVNDAMVTLVNWCVENGTFVEAEQALADVEGSKAVFTISAPVAGVVQCPPLPRRFQACLRSRRW